MAWESLALFVLAMTLTPGPNNLMIMTSGMNFGILRSVPHFLGICMGFPLLIVCVGLGLDWVVDTLPGLFPVIRLLGVGYLAYLAFGLIKQALPGRNPALNLAGKSGNWGERPMRFYEAVLFQWVNPKAWVMALAGLGTFANLDSNGLLGVLSVAGAHLVLGSPCVVLWMLGGYAIRRVLVSSRRRQVFNGGMGLLLIASLYPVLTTSLP